MATIDRGRTGPWIGDTEMVNILHRYVFWELCKVFFPATLALTLILSLGSLLRPIQNYGVAPGQVAELLIYFLPITLTLVLPIAALFAAALTYGRLANDNEIDACKASGISAVTLIYPGFLLAVVVAIANLALSFHVMPYFMGLADESINANIKEIVFRRLQRQGYYSVPPENRFAIYADYANPDTDSLHGVIVLRKQGARVDQIFATEAAKVSFARTGGFNEVRVTARNTVQMGLGPQAGEVRAFSLGQRFESLLADSVAFKCIDDMKRIQGNLLLFGPIEKRARRVCAQVMTELLADEIRRALAAGQSYELAGPGRTVRLSAGTVTLGAHRAIELAGPVEMTEVDRTGATSPRRWRCDRGTISVEGEEWVPALSLEVSNARSPDVAGTTLIRLAETGLVVPQAIVAKATAQPLLENLVSLQPLAPLAAPSPQLVQAVDGLKAEIRQTLAKIRAEIHSRLVFGIGCVPMILIGIGLGIIKRGGHLLSAFAVSCLPAVILVVGIVSGKHIATNADSRAVSGLALMWAGLAVLWLLALGISGRLARH
jgi:lipopolysaccharide export LptBFGC system permease protein LptF